MNETPAILPITIPERNIKLYLPLCLEKMDERQYIAFFALMYRLENKEIDFHDFSVLCIYELLNIKKGNRKLPEDQVEDALSNIDMLAEYILEYFSKEENVLKLKLQYAKNHIDRIELPFFKKYYGPVQYYHDVNFGEYEDGLNIFLQYSETPNRELLQQLMATFYRRKYSGKRYGYFEAEIEQATKDFERVSTGTLFGFYYNFAAFHTYFSGSQVYYNGQLIDLSILFSNQPEDEESNYQSPYPSLGIKSTGIEIAKTGILGNLEEVRGTNLWKVALLLYDSRKKDLDERARTKQLQNSQK